MAVNSYNLNRKLQQAEDRLAQKKRKELAAPGRINPLELDAIQTALGMSNTSIASAMGRSTPTWRKYRCGEITMSVEMEAKYRALARYRLSLFHRMSLPLVKLPESGEVAVVYYPKRSDFGSLPSQNPAHYEIYCQVTGLLCAVDPRVRLIAFDLDNYRHWLKGRDDSEVMRNMWAAQME